MTAPTITRSSDMASSHDGPDDHAVVIHGPGDIPSEERPEPAPALEEAFEAAVGAGSLEVQLRFGDAG
ncbi:MAG: hypothetical protein AAGA93_22585 [Actinomycetota bacterium]